MDSALPLATEENITELATQRWETAHDPRTRELVTALVRHIHDFAREVRLTEPEWMAAIQWLNRTGQISDDKREEFILASDVFGLSMLVVQMNHRFGPGATPATVLGPFHIDGSPELDFGADMSEGLPGTPLYVTGSVRSLDGGPVSGALLDVWQADVDGAYESQIPDIDEARLRAKYYTREDGTYCLRTIAPKATRSRWTGPSAT
jgi:hydroxyquinol 1,2-dioxygenase